VRGLHKNKAHVSQSRRMDSRIRPLLNRIVSGAATGLRLGVLALLGALLLSQGQSAALNGHLHPAHWHEARSSADLDRLFAQARRESKLVFVYWQPASCKPCLNPQSKLFNRDDFVQLSRRFVAIHIDGDATGTEFLARQLHVHESSPSTLMLSPERDELTRLSSELDAEQYLGVLRSTIGGSASRQAVRPIRQVVDDALTGLDLPNHEWRQLAHYAWEEAPSPLAEPRARARVLAQLAQACPLQLRASRARLLIQAVVTQGRQAPREASELVPEPLKRSAALALQRAFDDERSTRELIDLIAHLSPSAQASLTRLGGADGVQLRATWDRALQRLNNDHRLAADQRLAALQSRLDLARLSLPPASTHVPAPLRDEIRRMAVQLGNAALESPKQPANASRAARLLSQAGLITESDQLLRASLPGQGGASELMAQLADNARARGQFGETLLWSRRAWEAAQGPSRRLQWGAAYARQLVELAPGEVSLIDEVANQILAELTHRPEALTEPSSTALRDLAEHLLAWQVMAPEDPERHDRWTQQLRPACAGRPWQPFSHELCDGPIQHRNGA